MGNVLTWFGEVNNDMLDYLANGLLEMNSKRPNKITLVLNTHGGESQAGFAAFDLIRSNPKPVRIVVCGECSSAGTLILQAGAERLATEHSYMLIHFGNQGGSTEAEFQFDKRMHVKWIELMTEATKGKTNLHDMRVMHGRETYLTAQDALLHGLIDGITTKII